MVITEQRRGKHRAYAMQSYYENNESYVVGQRSFRLHFNFKRNDSVSLGYAIKL